MMKTKIFLFFAMLFFAGIFGATAQVKKHQKIQHHRIHTGVKSGEVTKKEQKVLNYRLHEVKQDAKLAKADGKVTRPEKRMIQKEQKRNSKLIYRAKHNKRNKK